MLSEGEGPMLSRAFSWVPLLFEYFILVPIGRRDLYMVATTKRAVSPLLT